jgi:hypothetical protein
MTKHTGIPTVYDGRQYRSRLEAKWACMFDLLAWKFEYEPFDLSGWIPDFLLIGKRQNVLVEIKPVTTFPEDVAAKIEAACPAHDCLILGCTLPVSAPSGNHSKYPHLVMGWLGERTDGGLEWGDAIMSRWHTGDGEMGFCHEYMSFHDRISGAYDGGHYGELGFDPKAISLFWNVASNATQWKGTQSVVS